MQLSNQHRKILLVLLGNNPRALRLNEIMDPIRLLKMTKWETSPEETKYPQPRVISASICRSLETLRVRGLIRKRAHAWHLTAKGIDLARQIGRELENQIKRLRRQIDEVVELQYLLKYASV